EGGDGGHGASPRSSLILERRTRLRETDIVPQILAIGAPAPQRSSRRKSGPRETSPASAGLERQRCRPKSVPPASFFLAPAFRRDERGWAGALTPTFSLRH